MPKINVDSDYLNHPKTGRLKSYCGLEADIFPIRLWLHCAKYFPKDGILKGFSGTEIEGILGWMGPRGNLVEALLKVGFLDAQEVNIGGGILQKEYRVHDWSFHAGFIWSYKIAGRKGGKRSGKSRTSKSLKNEATLEAKPQNASTIELNGIELNKDTDTPPTLTPVDKSVDNFKDTKDPGAPLTDVQKVVTVFKMCQGYEKDDKAWDRMYFGRFTKPAKELLGFLGSWRVAGQCVQDVYERLTAKGLTVTLETIAKHAGDWKKDRSEKEAKYGVFPVPGNGNRPINAGSNPKPA